MVEEKYILPEIVSLLKEVNLFPTITSSNKFSLQLVRELIANIHEKFGDESSLDYGSLIVEEMKCPSLLGQCLHSTTQI